MPRAHTLYAHFSSGAVCLKVSNRTLGTVPAYCATDARALACDMVTIIGVASNSDLRTSTWSTPICCDIVVLGKALAACGPTHSLRAGTLARVRALDRAGEDRAAAVSAAFSSEVEVSRDTCVAGLAIHIWLTVTLTSDEVTHCTR